MGRRAPPRRRARGGEGIPPTRATLTALALGAAAVLLALGLAGWLALVAGPDALWPVCGIGTVAAVGLVVTLAIGRPVPVAGGLALLGAAYAVILVVDDPPLDMRSAIVGATLLAVGELAHRSIEARAAVTEEAGTVARRVWPVAIIALIALGLGGTILAVTDLLRSGGLAIETVGIAAAAAAVGLLAVAARSVRNTE